MPYSGPFGTVAWPPAVLFPLCNRQFRVIKSPPCPESLTKHAFHLNQNRNVQAHRMAFHSLNCEHFFARWMNEYWQSQSTSCVLDRTLDHLRFIAKQRNNVLLKCSVISHTKFELKYTPTFFLLKALSPNPANTQSNTVSDLALVLIWYVLT